MIILNKYRKFGLMNLFLHFNFFKGRKFQTVNWSKPDTPNLFKQVLQ